MKLFCIFTLLLLHSVSLSSFAAVNNLTQIDSKTNGFGMYRTGKPTFEEFKSMVCDQKISEFFVMSGNGAAVEGEYLKQLKSCPQGSVDLASIKIHNELQNVRKRPLTLSYLNEFDSAVTTAQARGTRIAFRCNCGCHRTGRLAAYYEMKYMGKKPEEVMNTMKKLATPGKLPIGKVAYWWMVNHTLRKQVYGLYRHIHGYPCPGNSKDPENIKKYKVGNSQKHCVSNDPSPLTEGDLDDQISQDPTPSTCKDCQ
jgi:protein-tyrosine phosphatase